MQHKRTRKNRILTTDQRRFVEKNWIILSDVEMSRYLGTTAVAVSKLRSKMGLSRLKQKDIIKVIPLIIWMPRDSYSDYIKDASSLSLEDL